MTNSTLEMSNLSTENNDSSNPAPANFHDLFEDREFKDFVRDRFGYSLKTRGSVREKIALRLLNKEMNNLLQSSLTEVHLGYDGLQKLSQSKFKETVKTIKVTINYSNCEKIEYPYPSSGGYIPANALKLLSPNIFKNVKMAEVIIDKSIDKNCPEKYNYDYDGPLLKVDFDEFLYLRGLKILNQSQIELIIFSSRFSLEGEHDTKLEISNSQFDGIGLDCLYCKPHVYDINIINTPLWGIGAYQCIQSIFEGISVEGAEDSGVEMDGCDTIQLKNIFVKNCQAHNFWIWGCQNLDIHNISVYQSKIGVKFERSNGCIQDGIIEASTHGIVLAHSQISYRNVSVSCDDDGDVFKMDEQSSWLRLE